MKGGGRMEVVFLVLLVLGSLVLKDHASKTFDLLRFV